MDAKQIEEKDPAVITIKHNSMLRRREYYEGEIIHPGWDKYNLILR
jgi:hypothetical protein